MVNSDEESQYVGIIFVVFELNCLKKEKNFLYVVVINIDFIIFFYDGDFMCYIYIGVVGKLFLCFYIYGREVYVGDMFVGIDFNLIVFEIIGSIYNNINLIENIEGELVLLFFCLY